MKIGDLVRRIDKLTRAQVGPLGLIVGYFDTPSIGHHYPWVLWTDGTTDSPAWHVIEVVNEDR